MWPVRFVHPVGLIALLALLWVVFFFRKSRKYDEWCSVSGLSLALRLVLTVLLAVSLSGLQRLQTGSGNAVVFVMDHSDSISDRERARALAYVRQAVHTMQHGDKAGWVVFGKEAVVEQSLGASIAPAAVRSTPTPTGTDIAGALRLALLMLAPHPGAKKIVLLSDGQENIGDARREATLAATQGVRLDVVPLGASPQLAASDVAVTKVDSPAQVRVGEPFEITVQLQGSPAARVLLTLHHNGRTIASRSTTLAREGGTLLRFRQRLEAVGLHRYTVDIASEQDTLRQNNTGGAVVYAFDTPRILVLGDPGGSGVYHDILRRHAFSIETRAPAALPDSAAALATFDAIILDNVPAASFSERQMQAVAEYVRDYGGGVLMTGGAGSFGPGGYYRTPLEEILPVEMRVRIRARHPALALVLLLDKSGSMASEQEHRAKIEVAKTAVRSVLDVLDAGDAIGIIAFDKDVQPIVPLRRLTDREWVNEQMRHLQASGATAIHPALALAHSWLQQFEAEKKHVLLLSDGRTAPADFTSLVRLIRAHGIALSVVGIGRDVDRAFLRNLADLGRGRAYFTETMAELPAIFMREAVLITGRWLIERRFTPRLGAAHEIFQGIDLSALPALEGYVASTPKPRSRQLLVSDSQDPILAAWRYGLGRTLVFTTDLASGWTDELRAWPWFDLLWAHMVRWVSRRVQPERLHPRVTVDGDTATLVVDALGTDGRFLNFLDARAVVHAPDGSQHEVALLQSASGRYEGRFPITRTGIYLLSIVAAEARGTVEYTVHTGTYISTLPEYRHPGMHRELLEEVAGLTGGTILHHAESPFAREVSHKQYVDGWQITAFLALGLFFPDVALYRRGRRRQQAAA